MSNRFRKSIFKKISTKVISGLIAVVLIFSALGLMVTRELNKVESSATEAMNRSEGVVLIEKAIAASSDQIQAHYELILENRESSIAAFEAARQRRDSALERARSFAETSQEELYFEQLAAETAAFDDNFLNRVVPTWRAGDFHSALTYEKEADAILVSIKNRSTILATSFGERNEQAREASLRAAADARSYLYLAAAVALTLSLTITAIIFRRLNRPLAELKHAALAMIRGDLDSRVPVMSDDEVGELGRSFNMMATSVQKKIGQLTHLADIALAVSSELDWDRVMGVVMEKSMDLTGSDAASIVLYDEARNEFTDVYTRGLSDAFVAKMKFRPGGLAEKALNSDEAIFSDDVTAEYPLSKLARDEGLKAFICLPLKVRSRNLGIFYVYSKSLEAYSREDVSLLSILSNQAAIAIQNARMFEQSQEEAVTDGLTGLYNQRYFYSRLDEEVRRAARIEKPLSVIFFDLDRFKAFNDTNGHALGDSVLKAIAAIMNASKRAIDVAARYGGEEFVLILPDTDSSGAQIIAHRIRRRIAAFVFQAKDDNDPHLTASVGVTSYPRDGQEPQELVEKADWAMYLGKRKGGNSVTLFHEEAGNYGKLSLEALVREEFHMAAAQAMAVSAGSRSEYDKEHAETVAGTAAALAAGLGLGEDEIHQVRVAGLLHDIGLVSVPVEIINKRGSLLEEEWRRIREHPKIGAEILRHIASLEGFLPIIRHHHEHFDGSGYPDGLSRNEIPLGSRIISVADAFQAMISERPHRPAMPVDQALLELRRGAGRQFDPDIVDRFVGSIEDGRAKAS